MLLTRRLLLVIATCTRAPRYYRFLIASTPQTLIEAFVDVKTTDGYLIRLFAIAFTKRRPNQVSKTTYAQSAKIRQIRKKMFEVILKEASAVDLKGVVEKM